MTRRNDPYEAAYCAAMSNLDFAEDALAAAQRAWYQAQDEADAAADEWRAGPAGEELENAAERSADAERAAWSVVSTACAARNSAREAVRAAAKARRAARRVGFSSEEGEP